MKCLTFSLLIHFNIVNVLLILLFLLWYNNVTVGLILMLRRGLFPSVPFILLQYHLFIHSFIHSFIYSFIHSFLWHVQNAMISGASSIPLYNVLFPATLLHQLFVHPLSPHLAIYFLVYLSPVDGRNCLAEASRICGE